VGLVAACSVTVAVDPPDPPPEIASACAQMTARLPTLVLDQRQVDTEPESPLTAAWGSPAITLACGVPAPAGLGPTSSLVTVEGVDWFAETLTAGYRFTSVGQVAYVQVDVPDDYAPEVDPLIELAPAIGTLPPAP
jgi:hypothetical protein